MVTPGSISASASFAPALVGVPPVPNTASADRSYSFVRSSSSSGRAYASTDDRHHVGALTRRGGEDGRGVEAAAVVVQHDGRAHARGEEHRPLRGDVHQRRRGEPHASAGLGARPNGRLVRLVGATDGGDVQVALSPQDGFRAAGRPAGARDVDVVGRCASSRKGGLDLATRGDDRFEVDRARDPGRVAAVVELDQHVDVTITLGGELCQGVAEQWCEPALVDDATSAEHAEELGDLGRGVLVVHVARHRASPPAREDRLDVLGSVVHEDRDAILAALPVLELGSLAVDTQPALAQVRGEGIGARQHLAERAAHVAPHDHVAVGDGVADDVEDARQRPLAGGGHRPLNSGGRRST